MKRSIAIVLGICAWLLFAPDAQAQFIDCGPAGADCTDTLYGLGNDSKELLQVATGSHSQTPSRPPTERGMACGRAFFNGIQGRIRIREQNDCVASATTRCQVEIPQIDTDSGFFTNQSAGIDLGPLGLIALSFGIFGDYGGNIGHRQLSGTCGVSGDECALDSECSAQNPGDVCRSTCFDTGAACSSENDAACPGLCRTEIEWDGIGICTDDTTMCTSDSDCPGENICFAGFTAHDEADSSCLCCQSTLGVICPTLPGTNTPVEYPGLVCAGFRSPFPVVEGPDWMFDGARETRFELEIQVPVGQQEGVCAGNNQRSCGAVGDLWAGAENGKCTSGTSACAGDPLTPGDPALPSACDDVAFGGIAGDFCDLTEQVIRPPTALNPVDGTQNPVVCAWGGRRLVGTPGELCALPNDIPDGDPQPGCRLANIGVVGQPDLDCNGIDDTTEGVCMPVGGAVCAEPAQCPPCAVDTDCASGNCINGGDLCPFLGEENWHLDSNNDGIGDECQCGDGNGDGAISGVDIAAVAVCANDPLSNLFCDATIVDATGDNATTAEDIGGVVAVVNGIIQPVDLECIRNLNTTTP